MLNPVSDLPTDIGVIVGRFQVDDLHEGHHELLQTVASRHKKIIVVLGVTTVQTCADPLDYKAREFMLRSAYPDVTVVALKVDRSDAVWSRNLDAKIREIWETGSVTLYGSRDGFKPFYSGRFPVVELEATKKVSGTSIRTYVARETQPSRDFRRGVIYAVYGRHPISYTCVDAAVIDFDKRLILLARKNSDPEGCYRFFGGFVDITSDASLEAAVSREVREEAGSVGLGEPVYVGSQKIDDWRYRGQRDGIMSSLFVIPYVFGKEQAGDDVDSSAWFPVSADFEKIFVPEHQPLASLLRTYLNRVSK